MKIYLAARYSRYREMQRVRADLERFGHKVTSRWINGGHQIPDDGLSEQAKEEERTRFAIEDLTDICDADVLITFTEQPRTTNSRGGRHVEYGIALGFGHRVIIVGPRENIFHCFPGIECYPTYKSFKNKFLGEGGA